MADFFALLNLFPGFVCISSAFLFPHPALECHFNRVDLAPLSSYYHRMREKRTAREDNFLRHFGKRLRALREARGLTQEGLADNAGFSRSYYSDIETGKRNTSLLNLRRLAQSLHVSLSELLDVSMGDD